MKDFYYILVCNLQWKVRFSQGQLTEWQYYYIPHSLELNPVALQSFHLWLMKYLWTGAALVVFDSLQAAPLLWYSYLTNAIKQSHDILVNSHYLLSMSLSHAKNMHPRLFRTTRKMFSFFRKLSFSLLQVDLATIVSSLLFLIYGASSLPNLPAILTAILRILQICRVFRWEFQKNSIAPRPDICHFFSSNVLLGSIFLHMKAHKLWQK